MSMRRIGTVGRHCTTQLFSVNMKLRNCCLRTARMSISETGMAAHRQMQQLWIGMTLVLSLGC